VDRPEDPKASSKSQFYEPKLDWNEPRFNPAHPETFPVYLAKHRAWMLQLFASQFQRPPQLPQLASSKEEGN
jgi:hypothetical protein